MSLFGSENIAKIYGHFENMRHEIYVENMGHVENFETIYGNNAKQFH